MVRAKKSMDRPWPQESRPVVLLLLLLVIIMIIIIIVMITL